MSENIKLPNDWLSCRKVAAKVRKYHKKGDIGRTLLADWMLEVWWPTSRGDMLEQTTRWLKEDPARLEWARGLGLVQAKKKHDWSGLRLMRVGEERIKGIIYDAYSDKHLIYLGDNGSIWRAVNAGGGAGNFDETGRLILSPILLKETNQDDIDWSALELKHYDSGVAILFDKRSGEHLLDFCADGTVFLSVYTKRVVGYFDKNGRLIVG